MLNDKKPKRSPENQITGRDQLIIAQALATFIAIQPKLPFHMREPSNAADAKALLEYSGLGDLTRVMVNPHIDALNPFTVKDGFNV